MTEANSPAAELRCSADHLLVFIQKVMELSADANIGPKALSEAMPRLATKLQFDSYLDMLMEFMALAGRVRDDIALLSLRRENVRSTLISRLREIENIFDAKNFGTATSTILGRHFNQVNIQALEDISERLEAQGMVEKPLEQLAEAIADANAAAKAAEEFADLSNKARMLIKAHLDQLSQIVENYQDMGEQDFWSRYRVLFSAFIELHESITDPDGKEKSRSNLKKMLSRLVVGSSLAANAVTIGVPSMAALGL